jgi:hypothetical protein
VQLSSGLGGRLPSDEVAALHRIGWQESPEYALKRSIEPVEVATAALELIRNDAMTGQTLAQDAGFLLL